MYPERDTGALNYSTLRIGELKSVTKNAKGQRGSVENDEVVEEAGKKKKHKSNVSLVIKFTLF